MDELMIMEDCRSVADRIKPK